jgi:hypothetical protein
MEPVSFSFNDYIVPKNRWSKTIFQPDIQPFSPGKGRGIHPAGRACLRYNPFLTPWGL